MAFTGSSSFSEDGKYFCSYNQQGKLKIWETETGILKQEYIPNLHLSSPCTCLKWMKLSRNSTSPKKKRTSKSLEGGGDIDVLALGTMAGNILLYSIATGNIITHLEDGHSSAVNNITWSRGCNLFSCAGEQIVEWSIGDTNIKSKWKTGTEIVRCIMVVPDGKTFLSASRTISWWNLTNKQLIKTFTGHASDVVSLTFVPTSSATGDCYVVSAASGDRYLSAWCLNKTNNSKAQVASFVMEDVASSVSVHNTGEGEPTSMTAVTGTGSVHLYKHQLNGKRSKPLKPKVTVQIATDTGQTKEVVQRIPILGAQLCDGSSILIAHGSEVFLAFERISPDCREKDLCLVRQDPRRTNVTSEEVVSKVRIPETGDNVNYIASVPSTGTTRKRIHKLKTDVPMEERLENLALNKPEPKPQGPPRDDNMAQLLVQGLRSKDMKILQSVLCQRDEKLIQKTVLRLPVQVIIPLVEQLISLITERRVYTSRLAVLWLREVINAHASQLLANPTISNTFAPLLALIETKLAVFAPLLRLRGRLDLLLDQIQGSSKNGVEHPEESVIVYQDTYTSDEESVVDELAMNTDSEDQWEELSEVEEDSEESEVQSTAELIDVDMSS